MKRNSIIGTKSEISIIDSESDFFGEFVALVTLEGAIIVF